MQEDNDRYATDGSHQVAGERELAQDAVHAGAGLVEEIEEHGNLHQEDDAGDDEYQERVDGALRHHGAQ